MRRFLIGFGVCAALVIVALVGGVAYVVIVGDGLDSQARHYAEDSVAAITGRWQVQALLSRSSDKLKSRLSETETNALFVMFSRLGPLVASHGCTGQSSVYHSFTGQPSRTGGYYTCNASYEKGDATISLSLEKHGGTWQINGFHLNSDTLFSATPPRSL